MAGNKPGRSGEKTGKGGAKQGSTAAKSPTTSRGRVTPKATTGRYTPPIPREVKVSPRWVPILMFGCLGVGMIVIVLNYLSLLPGAPTNVYLLVGLILITVGFVSATQYH